jgi:predicted transcriptional regulator
MGRNRVTVQEAARSLGITEQAVRKRVKRGTLEHDNEAGRVYVYLDAGYEPSRDTVTNPEDERVAGLQAHIADLQRQLEEANTRDRENRRLLAAALERIPELEAPPANADEAEKVGGSAGVVEDPGESAEPEAATSQRPWWRRLLGR